MVTRSNTATSPTVLITGVRGFTGKHLKSQLIASGYQVYGLVNTEQNAILSDNEVICDITQYAQVYSVLDKIRPDYIVHLAAIAFVAHQNIEEMYRVNLFGTLNILQAVTDLQLTTQKILIASSANIYGNPQTPVVDESCSPLPVNHYANSKLAMENMVRTYFPKLPIIIVRPFNYTGIGQHVNFLIPKIVSHFQRNEKNIELGNTDIVRDFSDIRFVVNAYHKLLESTAHSVLVNICSGQGYSLDTVLNHLTQLAGYKINVQTNPKLMRENEIKSLIGSNQLLFELIGEQKIYNLFETLAIMYKHCTVV